MRLQVSPLIIAVDKDTKRTDYLKKLKNKELRELTLSTVSLSVDDGKETVEVLSFPQNIFYLNLDRILEILGVEEDKLIQCIGISSIALYGEKKYVNSCNLIRVYGNISVDRAFHKSIIALSTRQNYEEGTDKLQLSYDILDSLTCIKGALNGLKSKESKSNFYSDQEQDFLHDIENGFDDEYMLRNLRKVRYRRRKAKNDIMATQAIDENMTEQSVSKAISKINKLISVNRHKVYNRKTEKREII